jgi:hypothetical protein
MFENREFMRIFGPKRDAVTVGWKTCIMEKLNIFYSSQRMKGLSKKY